MTRFSEHGLSISAFGVHEITEFFAQLRNYKIFKNDPAPDKLT
jgi:hypothetical protein